MKYFKWAEVFRGFAPTSCQGAWTLAARFVRYAQSKSLDTRNLTHEKFQNLEGLNVQALGKVT